MIKRGKIALIATVLLVVFVVLLGFSILNYVKITGKAIEFGPELVECGNFGCEGDWVEIGKLKKRGLFQDMVI